MLRSSSLDNYHLFRCVSKNTKTCFNFSPLSEMRHSYMRYPISNRCTMPVYYRCLYSECPALYSRMTTPNILLRKAGCRPEYPASYNLASYSECPTPYKCALLRIDTIRSLALYKKPTPVELLPTFGNKKWLKVNLKVTRANQKSNC